MSAYDVPMRYSRFLMKTVFVHSQSNPCFYLNHAKQTVKELKRVINGEKEENRDRMRERLEEEIECENKTDNISNIKVSKSKGLHKL